VVRTADKDTIAIFLKFLSLFVPVGGIITVIPAETWISPGFFNPDKSPILGTTEVFQSLKLRLNHFLLRRNSCMRVRLLSEDDYPAIVNIHERLNNPRPECLARPKGRVDTDKKRHPKCKFQRWVAEKKGTVVAFSKS
jgi:hypothetical protein